MFFKTKQNLFEITQQMLVRFGSSYNLFFDFWLFLLLEHKFMVTKLANSRKGILLICLRTVRLDLDGAWRMQPNNYGQWSRTLHLSWTFLRVRNDFLGSTRFKKEIKKDLIQGI